MPPTSYTEQELKEFMHRRLRSVATQLGWSVDGGNYDDTVDDVLLAYEVADIADATNISKLRLLATREVWRSVVEETAGDYDVRSKDGAEAKRAQLNAQALKAYNLASDRYDLWVLAQVEATAPPKSGPATNQAVW